MVGWRSVVGTQVRGRRRLLLLGTVAAVAAGTTLFVALPAAAAVEQITFRVTPAFDESGNNTYDQERERVREVTAQACLDHAIGQRNRADSRTLISEVGTGQAGGSPGPVVPQSPAPRTRTLTCCSTVDLGGNHPRREARSAPRPLAHQKAQRTALTP